jgi:hypothetical protein
LPNRRTIVSSSWMLGAALLLVGVGAAAALADGSDDLLDDLP